MSALIALIVALFLQMAGAPAPQEDEPGWHCAVHGNRSCAPVHHAHVPGAYAIPDSWPCGQNGRDTCW